jgi:hypothetical protein
VTRFRLSIYYPLFIPAGYSNTGRSLNSKEASLEFKIKSEPAHAMRIQRHKYEFEVNNINGEMTINT